MNEIKQVLEKDGVPAVRLLWTNEQGNEKPARYYTFQLVARTPALCADDVTIEETETYLVKVFSKENEEAFVDSTIQNLEDADCVIRKIGQEAYDSVTGYFCIPITVQMLKE